MAVYLYDGSFEGMLCCIFEACRRRETPDDILRVESQQQTLFCPEEILSDREKARRVLCGVSEKASPAALKLLRLLYLTAGPRKEMLALEFVRLAIKKGRGVCNMHGDKTVSAVEKAVKHLTEEAHLYKGFVRFSVYNGTLFAAIEPKNFVLPLLAAHFAVRYNGENFMIHDRTHKQALLYSRGRSQIVPADKVENEKAEAEELACRRLWKLFYYTVAIEARDNPVCRRTHMPKRYWNCMTEFEEQRDDKRLAGGEKRVSGD